MKNKFYNTKSIYVQIAAYRDPELLPTLRDMFAKAKYPNSLRVGLVWQHSPYDKWDTLAEFKNDSRLKVIDIDYRDAKGVCQARHKLNLLYKNERYTLQLDSHHRFTQDWDTTLIAMLESVRTQQSPKPLLSSYLPSFDPSNDPASRLEAPWIMEFDRFAPEGPVHFLPHTIDNWKELDKPVPSKFISGHFIFADGKFCSEVTYDPEYYFHGEEINLSVRAYMAGYDLYAPHRVVMWHEYTRNNKKKHWDDVSAWNALDKRSYARNKAVLGIDTGVAELNNIPSIRTLREYEMYSGLEFATRKVHVDTLARKLPPISVDAAAHDSNLTNYRRMIVNVYRPLFTETDYNVWAVAFEDATGKEIYRQDAHADEIKRLLETHDNFVHIWRNFYAPELPTKWVVWPHSESKGWQERLTGEFRHE
jgi:hypothetical protein